VTSAVDTIRELLARVQALEVEVADLTAERDALLAAREATS
jgi:uncharacterized small protein (DUF1192 family)